MDTLYGWFVHNAEEGGLGRNEVHELKLTFCTEYHSSWIVCRGNAWSGRVAFTRHSVLSKSSNVSFTLLVIQAVVWLAHHLLPPLNVEIIIHFLAFEHESERKEWCPSVFSCPSPLSPLSLWRLSLTLTSWHPPPPSLHLVLPGNGYVQMLAWTSRMGAMGRGGRRRKTRTMASASPSTAPAMESVPLLPSGERPPQYETQLKSITVYRCDESSQCLPEGTKCRVLLGS